jgi:hypothetical protein
VSLARRKVELRGRSVPLGLASFRSRLTALIVALSLVAQLIAAPYHRALSLRADPTAIAADLKAMFGGTADLCARGEDHSVPTPLAPAGHCDDQCPLCRFAAQAAAFVPPDVAQLPERLGADRHAIRAPPDFGAFSVRRAQPNRARAPPLAV